MPVLPPIPVRPRGGTWSTCRTFNAAAVASQQTSPAELPTPAQAAAPARADEPPYIPPTDWMNAEEIGPAGKGPLFRACLFTPREPDGTPYGPQRLAVWAETRPDVELDLAGAIDLRAQLLAFLPRLDAMIGVLAGGPPAEPPESQQPQPTGSGAEGGAE